MALPAYVLPVCSVTAFETPLLLSFPMTDASFDLTGSSWRVLLMPTGDQKRRSLTSPFLKYQDNIFRIISVYSLAVTHSVDVLSCRLL